MSPVYAESARACGRALAERGIELVYGGGRVGLMGVAADAALAAGGRVIGIIPSALASSEIAHDGLTELHVVPGMHERKAMMAQLSDAFLTLPGGVGTFEEFFEVLSWAVLGLHTKPMALLNVHDSFTALIELLENTAEQGFMRRDVLDHLIISSRVEQVLDAIATACIRAPARSRA